jgi:hypothetical protein
MYADRPVVYTTRITRSKGVHISNGVSEFGCSGLPAIYSAWIIKEIVRKTQHILFSANQEHHYQDFSWLDTYWDDEEKTLFLKLQHHLILV